MEYSRRSFLKTAGAAGLGAITFAGMAGCAPQASSGKAKTSPSDADGAAENIKYSKEEEFDLVVVGSGTAGLVAAVHGKELGMNVVLLEKNTQPGGTSACTEGMFAVGTKMQADIGFEAIPNKFIQMIEEYCHWTNNERVLKRYVANSGESVNWMMKQGVKFSGIVALGSDNLTWHIYDGYGAAATKKLYENAVANGVDVRLGVSGKQLITNEDGSVNGVVAVDGKGEGVLLKAPAIILATGGISNSPEMMKKYTYDNPDRWQVRGIDGRTGDGWKMGLSAGAALHFPCAVMEAEATVDGILDYEDHVYAASAGAPGLWVNQDAIRYCDEYNAASNFTYYGSVSGLQAQTYVISDTSFMESQRDDGIRVTTCAMLQKGSPLPDLMELLDRAIASKSIVAYRADTIADLADQLGLDPKALQATVDAYNKSCEKGEDEEFRKDPSMLWAMKKAPYYGFAIKPTYMTTVGGLKVDEYLRVLREDGSVIKGLFALGGDGGGVYGYAYDVGAAAGSQQGWCVTGGRLATDYIKDNIL